MSRDRYAPASEVRECVLADRCAGSHHRDRQDVFVGALRAKLARSQLIRPAAGIRLAWEVLHLRQEAASRRFDSPRGSGERVARKAVSSRNICECELIVQK